MATPSIHKLPLSLEADPDLKRDAVYEQVLLDIICAELRPGERVDEIALAERYGRAAPVSATRSIVSRWRGWWSGARGSAPWWPSRASSSCSRSFSCACKSRDNVLRLAARNARKDEIEAINRAFVDADRAIAAADWRSVVRFDRAFHHAMAAAAHNVWLERTLLTLHNSALRFWHHALPRRPVDAVKGEIAGHLEVAAAIAARDPAGAQAAMRAVLGEFPATVQGLFSDALEPLA